MMTSILRSVVVAGLLVGLTGLVGCSGKPDADVKKGTDQKQPEKQPGSDKQAEGQAGTSGKTTVRPVDITQTPAGPKQSLDLSYVAPQFFAAVVVYPQRLAASSVASAVPQDELLKDFIDKAKLDPRIIQQAVILITPEAVVGNPEAYVPGAILRFTEDIDGKKFLESHWDNTEEATIGGEACYTSKFPGGKTVAVYFPDARTAVFGDKATLGNMLAASGAKSPLLARLAQVDAQGDVIAVASLEPLAKMIDDVAAGMEGNSDVPPQAAMAVSAAKDLKAAAITLDLTGPVMIRIELDGKDATGTARIESTVSQNIESGREMFGQMREMIASQLPPEVGKPLVKLADDFLAGISVKKAAGQVVVTAKRPDTLDDVVKSLTPLAMAAVDQARDAARRTQQMNNLRQIALGMHIYADAHKALPAEAIRDKEGKPLLSWRVALLQCIEEEALYKEFHLDEPWDSEHNKKLLERMPEVYESRGVDAPDKTSMMVFTGEGTPFGGQQGPKFADITDGTTNTIMLIEAGPDKAVPWTKPEDLPFDKENPSSALGDVPSDGFLAAFLDGSVQVIAKTIDPETLSLLIQHADGKPIDRDF